MFRLLKLTISTPLPHGVTTSVLLRGTSCTAPAAAGAGAVVGAGAAGAVVGLAAAGAVVAAAAGAVVGAAATAGAVVGLAAAGAVVAAAAAGGAVADGGGAEGALWHAVAKKTSPTPKRTKG